MGPKRKRTVDFVDGFERPNETATELAYGSFPLYGTNTSKMLKHEEELLATAVDGNTSVDSIRQLNNNALFVNKQNVWKELPYPIDDDSWLAKYIENGQSVDDYVRLVSGASGKFSKRANASNNSIYIIPIVEHTSSNICWPENAPDLNELCNLVSAWFNRKVIILDYVSIGHKTIGKVNNIGTDSKVSNTKFIWHSLNNLCDIPGRISSASGHYQLGVDGLLAQLGAIQRSGTHNGVELIDNFATIGITMMDLYSHNSDLFIAGFACSVTKVSVLSFARYHPRMKMSPFHWYDYGFIKKNTSISYYLDHMPIPKISTVIPKISSSKSDLTLKTELFRRAGKLFAHEIGHIYGLEHCIHHQCNMNGTAHLIEDFAAPSYWCGICLRKLQYRLGFDVCKRYEAIRAIYKRVGLMDEFDWITKRLENIQDEN